MKLPYYPFLLFLFSLLPIVNLFHNGLPDTHDGLLHVARAASFFGSLAEGNLVPRWAGNLNMGYGHPALEFYYPAPSYIIAPLYVLGFSFVDSIKILFGLAYIGSIVVMYAWAKESWGEIAGLVAAILYGFAPYRFVDMYIRGAVGEQLAFFWMPLILLTFIKYAREQSLVWFYLGVFSLVGLFLSHNVVVIMFLPLVGLYIFYLTFFVAARRKMFVIGSLLMVFLGLTLSAFYWLPAYLEGKYTLRDIVTTGQFSDRFVSWNDFIISPWRYGGGSEFTKALGWPHVFFTFLSLVFIKTLSREKVYFLGGSLILFFMALFIMTKESKILWNNITLLQKFQFPWRFLTITTLLSSVVGGVVVSVLAKRTSLLGVILILIVITASTVQMWKAKSYTVYADEYFTQGYNGTTDSSGENSPIWSVRFMESPANAHLEAIDGKADIREEKRFTTRHEYTVYIKEKTRLVENTLYFPGWKVFANGQELPLEFQDPRFRGLMTFFLEPGTYAVSIVFSDTKLRKMANLVSIGSISLLGLSLLVRGVVWKKNYSR